MRALALIAIVVLGAALQTALVWTNPDVTATPFFALLAAGSMLVAIVEVWLVVLVVARGRAGVSLLWVVGFAAIAAAAAVWVIPALPVVLLAGVLVLPGLGERTTNPLVATGRAARGHPLRLILIVLAFVVAAVVAWVAALSLVFFLTGPLADFATWLFYGAVIVLMLWASSRWHAK